MIWVLVLHVHYSEPYMAHSNAAETDFYLLAPEPAVFVRQDACEAIAKARAQVGLECKQLMVTE